MRKLLCSLIFIVSIFFSSTLYALIDYAPLVGYAKGSHEQKVGDSTVKGTYTDMFAGMELTTSIVGIILGVRGQIATGQYTRDALAPKSSIDTNQSATEINALLGYAFLGLPLRIWGAYTLERKMDVKNLGVFGATGFKFGLGFNVGPKFRINAEYGLQTYKVFKSVDVNERWEMPYTYINQTFKEKTSSVISVFISFPSTLI
ncbi:MAG: hypothetical protein HQK49_07715 [Oligoflexia bacterium]|nr:hypothetical protein [Oligoflexia bacterium]